jgi:hypothetical protein
MWLEKMSLGGPPSSSSERILEAILRDDADSLSTLLSDADDVNGRLWIQKYRLPPILEDRPPFAALAAFFRALPASSFL